MNDPIISPWWFYLAGIIDNFRILFCFLAGMSVVVAGTSLLLLFDDWDVERKKTVKQWLKISAICCCIFLPLAIITPGKEIVYKMIAAQYMTLGNISTVKDFSVQTIEEIAKAIQGEASHGQE